MALKLLFRHDLSDLTNSKANGINLENSNRQIYRQSH